MKEKCQVCKTEWNLCYASEWAKRLKLSKKKPVCMSCLHKLQDEWKIKDRYGKNAKSVMKLVSSASHT